MRMNIILKIFRSRYSKIFFLFILISMVMLKGEAQQSINYALEANIIYRFTKYIDWPDSKKFGDFTIGIFGDEPLYDVLEHFVENKTVENRRIVVKNSSTEEDFLDCDILFIPEDKSNSLKSIATITKYAAVLIVTESGGLASKGSCINFSVIDEHLKLEINKNNIEQRNLNIATELLSLGTIVE
jgi:hypothetical protein